VLCGSPGGSKAAPKMMKNISVFYPIVWQSLKIIYFCSPKRFRMGLKSEGQWFIRLTKKINNE
jgi:hypothetical protein